MDKIVSLDKEVEAEVEIKPQVLHNETSILQVYRWMNEYWETKFRDEFYDYPNLEYLLTTR